MNEYRVDIVRATRGAGRGVLGNVLRGVRK